MARITDMKSPVKIALLAASVIEAVNFFLLAPPIDVGYPPGTPWYINLIGLQWVILHWPSGLFLNRFERVFGCQQFNIVMGCRWVDIFVFFVIGYLDTALLLIAIILGLRWIPQLRRR